MILKFNRTFPLLAMVTTAAAPVMSWAIADTPAPAQIHFPKDAHQTFVGPEQYFSGTANVELIFPANETAHYSAALVTFDAGARSAWHSHPAGQHLYVTSGTAITATREGQIFTFKEGDAVWCPENIDHWHGAMPNASMTHLVVTGSVNGQVVTWKEKVSDEEYRQAVVKAQKN